MITVSRAPSYSTLYDHFVVTQAHRALVSYNAALGSFLGTSHVTDENMLEQLAVAERIVHSFSTAFTLLNKDGVRVDTLCRNDVRRTEALLTHVVDVFTYLNALLHHPAYTMLSTCRAVHDRQKPLGALRDIRWTFTAENQGLVIQDEATLFRELSSLLFQITRSVVGNGSIVTQTALSDFEGYMYDEKGNNLITHINFGTAAVLAQSVVESSKKFR